MSFNDAKISNEQIQQTGIQSQPDIMSDSAKQNKLAFDALPTLIIQKVNSLIDQLQQQAAAGQIGVTAFEGMTATNVQQALEELHADIGGNYGGIDGAGKVGYTPSEGVDASNVQAAIEAVQANLATYIAKIKAVTGAAEVGNAPIVGMTATNVQQALEELRENIDNIVSGVIPGGSITSDMLQDGAVMSDKLGSDVTGDTIPTSASDPTTISSQLSNRVNSIPVAIDPTVDVLTLKSGHVYTVEGEISKTYNHPIDAVYDHLTYNVYGSEYGSNGYKSIICKEAYSNRIWIKTQQYKLWLNWELVSLATPPQEFVLPLADGFVHCDPGTKSTYSKSQEGLVVVHFYCKKADGTDIVQNDTIAMLPEGFHPSANVHIPANVSFDGSSVYSQDVATVVVGGNGRVWIAYPPAGCKAVTSTLVFYAAS